ncbi:MAG TPA: hypothetical protein VIL27_05890, partial [Clostridia bacterium]
FHFDRKFKYFHTYTPLSSARSDPYFAEDTFSIVIFYRILHLQSSYAGFLRNKKEDAVQMNHIFYEWQNLHYIS